MDSKKIFDDVFGEGTSSVEIPITAWIPQTRGIPVRLTAFDVNSIHRKMVEAFDSVIAIEKEMNQLSWKLNRARREFSYALVDLEIRIHAQEEESGIGGTKFRVYKPGENEDGDRATEV